MRFSKKISKLCILSMFCAVGFACSHVNAEKISISGVGEVVRQENSIDESNKKTTEENSVVSSDAETSLQTITMTPEEYYNPSGKSLKNKVLGVERAEWIKGLTDLGIDLERSFLDNLAQNEKALKLRRGADYYKPLNSDNDPVRKIQESPLRKRPKKKSRYIADMSLDRMDYGRVLGFIPEMKRAMADEAIEMFLPYISLALSYGMRFSDVQFYIRRDISIGSPVDIAIERLYREIKIENGEF